jgi:hypothetical protein
MCEPKCLEGTEGMEGMFGRAWKIHGKIHGKSAWVFDLSAEVPRVAERKLTL